MYPHERSLVQEMQGRPFALLGVNSDSKIERAQKAVKDNDLNWRSFYMGRGGGKAAKDYKVRGWPTIVLIDHKGVVRKYQTGGANLDKKIEELVQIAENDGGDASPVAGGSSLGGTSEMRTFASAAGKFKIEAEFVKFEGGKAHLKRDDGKVIQVPMTKLSADDQKWIREELKKRRE